MFRVSNLVINPLKSFSSIWNASTWIGKSSFSTFTQPLCIQMSNVLMASPMKRKKKPDPQITKLRTERKRKRLWRDVKRLMKHQKQLKPLDEMEIPYNLVDEPQKYARERPILSAETLDDRSDLLSDWTTFKTKRHSKDLQMIDRIEYAQDRALTELKRVSTFLYDEAVKVDEMLLPFSVDGPTLTPPIKDFDPPDGAYINVTRKWDPPNVPELDKKLKRERAKKFAEEKAKEQKAKEEKGNK